MTLKRLPVGNASLCTLIEFKANCAIQFHIHQRQDRVCEARRRSASIAHGKKMHLIADESVDIQCAVDDVYAYTCDLEKFGQWFPGVITIVAENALDFMAPGKSYLETVAVPLRGQRQVRIQVKEAERNKLFITEGSLRPLLPCMEVRFSASGPTSTRVTWKMHSRSQSSLLRATLIPLARRVMKTRARQGVANLKRCLESQGQAT